MSSRKRFSSSLAQFSFRFRVFPLFYFIFLIFSAELLEFFVTKHFSRAAAAAAASAGDVASVLWVLSM